MLTDLNIEDKNGWTPLHHAVRNNAINAIEFLLDQGIDDVRLNKQHEAPIHLAVIHNQLEALKVNRAMKEKIHTFAVLFHQ
mgnify:CR=1 FL=1